MATKDKIRKEYIEFELLNGRPPHSVFELTKKIKIEETEFYKQFTSLEGVRQSILSELITQTLNTLDNDEDYRNYSAREQLLALYYTLFERFRNGRSYLMAKYKDILKSAENGKDWKPFLNLLVERSNEILSAAMEKNEIKERPVVGNHYAKSAPVLFFYIFRVWLNDTSADFQDTDAAIEKSVNTSMDLMGDSPLESLFDFGKFALKTKLF